MATYRTGGTARAERRAIIVLFGAAFAIFLLGNILLAHRSEQLVQRAQHHHEAEHFGRHVVAAALERPRSVPPPKLRATAQLAQPTLPATAASSPLASFLPPPPPPPPPTLAAASAAGGEAIDPTVPLGGGPGLPKVNFAPFYLGIPFVPASTSGSSIRTVQRAEFFKDCAHCDHGTVHNATHRRFEGQNYENGGAVLYRNWKMLPRGQSSECGWKSPLRPPQYEAASETPLTSGVATIPKVALILVPYCGVYQHFVDGVLPKIAQSWPAIKEYPVLFDFMKKTEKGVREVMEDILGMTLVSEPVYDAWVAKGTVAQSFAHVCRAPGIHPQLWRRARSIVLSNARLDQLPPLAGHQTVAYFVRNTKMATNGRNIANEKQLVEALQTLLGGKLQLISYDKTQHVRDQMHMVSNKKLLVAGHGGALYNHYWAPLGATVIEIAQLSSHPNMKDIFWKSIAAMGQKYVRIPPQGGSVDVNLVVGVIRGLPDFKTL